jgi:N-acetylglutamate synthase-like GNAT family acetyltransferase
MEITVIKIVSPQTREDFKTYYDLRYKVLREPWGMQRGTEKDDFEPISDHYMAIDETTGELVGAVKLFEKETSLGWSSHLAVKDSWQRKGVGKQLLTFVEQKAKEKGFKALGCLSRLNTTAFFEKEGYTVVGLPVHYLGTTQVVWMQKSLE